MNRSRLVTWSIAAGLVVIAGLWAFWPRAILVDIAEVTTGPLSVNISEEGEARIHDVYVVSAPSGGHLERIEVEAGDCVYAGETVLVGIRPAAAPTLDARTVAQLRAAVSSARAAVTASEADVQASNASLLRAQSDLVRVRKLAGSGTVSPQALERAETEVRTLRAARDSARAAYDLAKYEVRRSEAALLPPSAAQDAQAFPVLAPISGTVLRVLRESEGPIQAGMSILEIGDPADMEIVADLLSEQAVRVSIGDRVTIRGWGGQPLGGEVRRVEPYAFTKISALGIEEQRTYVHATVRAPPASLGHGYRVRLDITIWEGEDIIRAPMTALFKSGRDWSVYRIERGRARLVRVEVGHINDQAAEIVSGLSSGDVLIAHASNRIEDGVKVTARKAPVRNIEPDQPPIDAGSNADVTFAGCLHDEQDHSVLRTQETEHTARFADRK